MLESYKDHIKQDSNFYDKLSSLQNYLERHPSIEQQISKKGEIVFYSTDMPDNFSETASLFWGEKISASQLMVY